MSDFNWKWDGIWCSAGDPKVWSTSMTAFEALEQQQPDVNWGDLFPAPLHHISTEVEWDVVKDETEGNTVDLWETKIDGYHLIIFNA